MTRYRADDLFTLREGMPIPGKPDWMNLRAVRRPEWRGEPPALTGPGLYGVFLDDKLFYIGLYAGKTERPFGGSVLDRWHKHATHHTLRGAGIVFARSQLERIVSELAEGPGIDIKACFEAELAASPLIETKGGSCTFNKARFAARHWEALGPGNETALLGRLSFVYHQLPRDWEARLAVPEGITPSRWVKREWLRAAEATLIRELQPICNAETTFEPAQDGIGPDAVADHIAVLLGTSAPVEASATPRIAAASLAIEVNERDEDLSTGEQAFRSRMSSDGEALLDDLEERCPRGMSFAFTETPELRLYVNQPRRRVLMTLAPRKNGMLRCETQANAAACSALGFDAEALEGATMAARFVFDLAKHDLTDLVAAAGAAVQALAK